MDEDNVFRFLPDSTKKGLSIKKALINETISYNLGLVAYIIAYFLLKFNLKHKQRS